MKYLCLVYLEEQKLRAVADSECRACGEGFRRSGLLVAAEALQPALDVRRNGRRHLIRIPGESGFQVVVNALGDCRGFSALLTQIAGSVRAHVALQPVEDAR